MIGGLYGMADAGSGDPRAQVVLLARHAVGVVQLRCKGWDDRALEELALHATGLGLRVVVNDRVEVARAAGAWVHLGQGDGADPSDVPFGRSCHTLDQVEAVAALVAAGRPDAPRYIGFGPVFTTATKETGYSPRGVAALAEAVRASPIPVVAIGGIALHNLEEVRATGVAGWAVIGGIWGAPDPSVAIEAFSGGAGRDPRRRPRDRDP